MVDDNRMEFWVTLAGLLRRGRVLLAALVIAVAAGAGVYLATPQTYVSSTSMVLTTTQFGGTESQDPTKQPDLTNPMLNFNESLKTTSAILIEAMNTKAVASELGATDTTKLVIDDGRTNPDLLGLNGPFIYIVGESPSAAEASRVVADARAVMKAKLLELQTTLNAPASTYVGLVDVVAPTPPAPSRARALKLGLLALLGGFLLSMTIAYGGHQIRIRRHSRAMAASDEDSSAPPSLSLTAATPAPRPTPPRAEPDPVLVRGTANGTATRTTTGTLNGRANGTTNGTTTLKRPPVKKTPAKRSPSPALVSVPVKTKVKPKSR